MTIVLLMFPEQKRPWGCQVYVRDFQSSKGVGMATWKAHDSLSCKRDDDRTDWRGAIFYQEHIVL